MKKIKIYTDHEQKYAYVKVDKFDDTLLVIGEYNQTQQQIKFFKDNLTLHQEKNKNNLSEALEKPFQVKALGSLANEFKSKINNESLQIKEHYLAKKHYGDIHSNKAMCSPFLILFIPTSPTSSTNSALDQFLELEITPAVQTNLQSKIHNQDLNTLESAFASVIKDIKFIYSLEQQLYSALRTKFGLLAQTSQPLQETINSAERKFERTI